MKRIFYVYEHWRPDSDVCFYVGKGKGSRSRQFRYRNAVYQDIANRLASLGMCIEVRMVASGLTEREAFSIERRRIRFWRSAGIKLANLTDGGDGFSGFVRPIGITLSAETKEKMSRARMGIKFTTEHRGKLAARKLGVKRKPFTEETRAKMRAAASRREEMKRQKFGKVTRTCRLKEPTA